MNDSLIENLCGAAYKGDLEEVRRQIKHLDIHTFVNCPNNRGQTALYCAARMGHVPVVLELLNFAGIDGNIQVPDNGSTPGHAAAFGPHPEVLALLIVHGVDLDIKNKHGLTPRKEARKQCIDVFKLFEGGGVEKLKTQYPICLQLKTTSAKLSADQEVVQVTSKQSRKSVKKITDKSTQADFKAHFRCLLQNISCHSLPNVGTKKPKAPSAILKFDFAGAKKIETECVKKDSNPSFKTTSQWDWTANHVHSMYKKYFVIDYCVERSMGSKVLGQAKLDCRALVTGPEKYELEIFNTKDKSSLGWVHFELIIEEFSKPSMYVEIVVSPLHETQDVFLQRSFFFKLTQVPMGVTKLSGLPHVKSPTLAQLGSHAFALASHLPESSFKGLSRGSLHLTLLSKKKADRKTALHKSYAHIQINKILSIARPTSCTEQLLDMQGRPVARITCQFKWVNLPCFVQMFGGKYNSATGLANCVAVPRAMPFQIKGENVAPPKRVAIQAPTASESQPNQGGSAQTLNASGQVGNQAGSGSIAHPVPQAAATDGKNQSDNWLPPEWEEAIDEVSGRVYYLNHLTKHTQWDCPIASFKSGPNASASESDTSEEDSADAQFIAKWNASQTQLPTLPPNWESDIDELGRIYYIDHTTKQTQWTHPLLSEQLLQNEVSEKGSDSSQSQGVTMRAAYKEAGKQTSAFFGSPSFAAVTPQETLTDPQPNQIQPTPTDPNAAQQHPPQQHPQQPADPNAGQHPQQHPQQAGPPQQALPTPTVGQQHPYYDPNAAQPPAQPTQPGLDGSGYHQNGHPQQGGHLQPGQPQHSGSHSPQHTLPGYSPHPAPESGSGYHHHPPQQQAPHPYALPQQPPQDQSQQALSPAALAIQAAIAALPPGTDPSVLAPLQMALASAIAAQNNQPNPFNTNPGYAATPRPSAVVANPFNTNPGYSTNPLPSGFQTNPFNQAGPAPGSPAGRTPTFNPFLQGTPPPTGPNPQRMSLTINPFQTNPDPAAAAAAAPGHLEYPQQHVQSPPGQQHQPPAGQQDPNAQQQWNQQQQHGAAPPQPQQDPNAQQQWNQQQHAAPQQVPPHQYPPQQDPAQQYQQPPVQHQHDPSQQQQVAPPQQQHGDPQWNQQHVAQQQQVPPQHQQQYSPQDPNAQHAAPPQQAPQYPPQQDPNGQPHQGVPEQNQQQIAHQMLPQDPAKPKPPSTRKLPVPGSEQHPANPPAHDPYSDANLQKWS